MLRRAPAVEFTKHQIALQRTCVSGLARNRGQGFQQLDRKSTRLNSSHSQISYAVFCLKKKTKITYKRQEINFRNWQQLSIREPIIGCRPNAKDPPARNHGYHMQQLVQSLTGPFDSHDV